MTSIYYSAAWTDSGFLLGCSHQHKTVTEATSCIRFAVGYVVAFENAAMRCLRAAEEFEFQRGRRSNNDQWANVLGNDFAPSGAKSRCQ